MHRLVGWLFAAVLAVTPAAADVDLGGDLYVELAADWGRLCTNLSHIYRISMIATSGACEPMDSNGPYAAVEAECRADLSAQEGRYWNTSTTCEGPPDVIQRYTPALPCREWGSPGFPHYIRDSCGPADLLDTIDVGGQFPFVVEWYNDAACRIPSYSINRMTTRCHEAGPTSQLDSRQLVLSGSSVAVNYWRDSNQACDGEPFEYESHTYLLDTCTPSGRRGGVIYRYRPNDDSAQKVVAGFRVYAGTAEDDDDAPTSASTGPVAVAAWMFLLGVLITSRSIQ